MNYEYKFFIGANNQTNRVELDKVVSIFTSNVQGFTISETLGYWKGKRETSVIVTIVADINDRYQMQLIKKQLEQVLKQDSVLLTAHSIECL